MKGETWMHAKTPQNPDPSMEERCAFYRWALDQLEAGLPVLDIAQAAGLRAESDLTAPDASQGRPFFNNF